MQKEGEIGGCQIHSQPEFREGRTVPLFFKKISSCKKVESTVFFLDTPIGACSY